ncbi:MAG: DUF1491 family protein [Pseudomonadota bacterium]|nr:DUF1491 family protein [Pseudomonadota bacterium]
MSEVRLAPRLEASAFLRRAESVGGFGMILHQGNGERGTLLLSIAERGESVACLARELGLAGYEWRRVGPDAGESEKLRLFLEKRSRNDPDEWQIELDVPSAERFIAETSLMG